MCYGFSPVFLPKFHAYATRQCSARSFLQVAASHLSWQVQWQAIAFRHSDAMLGEVTQLHGLRHPKSGDSRKVNLHQSLCARTMVSLKHQGKCPESSFRVLLRSPCCSRSQANQGGFHLQRPRLGTVVGVWLRHSG